MKKISIFLAFILGIVILVFPITSSLAAELDQSFQGGPATDINIYSRDFVGQTFIPTMPALNWISAYLVSFETPRQVHAELIRASNGTTVATSNQTIQTSWGWRSIIGTATLTPGELYMLKLTTTAGNIYWRSGASGYPSGIAYTPGADGTKDMWFQTYGTPGSSSAVSPGASSSSGTSSGSSGANISPSGSNGTASDGNKGLHVFGFLDSGGPIWKNFIFWVLVAFGVILVGLIIWYIIDRLKRKKKEKNKFKYKK